MNVRIPVEKDFAELIKGDRHGHGRFVFMTGFKKLATLDRLELMKKWSKVPRGGGGAVVVSLEEEQLQELDRKVAEFQVSRNIIGRCLMVIGLEALGLIE